ncbi:MAG TPA: hypothetical protein VFM31_03625 [Nitrososphaeraceae archaeon]|nr:hypothetical protein [Nitrososphaeraceae archaeon]
MFKVAKSSLKIIKFSTISILIFLSLPIIVTAVVIISNNNNISSDSSGYKSSPFFVFAQMEKDTKQKMLMHSQSMANSNNSSINSNNSTTTFSAIGTISSLVITVPENEFNITNAFKVILTGDWNLNVNNGTVTNFEASFLASPMDGSKGHIHQITNFSANENDEMNQLISSSSSDNSNNLTINGTVDIKINGRTIWSHAELSITISNNSTITIDPNDKQTDNHFGDQQVYGIVNRLIVM